MSGADFVMTVARWHMDLSRVPEVLTVTTELRRHTLEEPGCLGYDVFQSVDRPGEVLLLERYRDSAAIDAHRASAHYQALVAGRILPLLSDRSVEFLVPRSGGG